ncbi:MAG TPA: hypothetical protein DEA43_02025 [Candidatus Moranbacteria bacterium]|nr:hypothetical protein [Candidatus Moranbacteria bacterium]HBT45641.1 hypothetical protein [Candidatus Moranbacteria bacterium]
MKIYLDLLPKQRKTELKRKKLFRRILREEFLFLLPIILFIIILFNIFYLLSIERNASLAAKSAAESQDKYQELSLYEEKFKQVNENASKLVKIQEGHFYWAEIFNKLSAATPEEIAVTDFSTKDRNVYLVGKAKSRDVLLEFKDELEKNECYENINVPLSNLVVKNDIVFQMDFLIKMDCLKKTLVK